MRHLNLKDFDNPPSILNNNTCHKQTNKACVEAKGKEYNGHFYRHETVTNLLRAYSLGKETIGNDESAKCNYCESKIEHAATLQVEHYRPKAEIDKKDTNNQIHKGYFWLGNEWTNLLLSCPKCNGKNAKGNRFPIVGTRVNAHNPVSIDDSIRTKVHSLDRTLLYANLSPLIDEKPILINPEIDEPEDFLSFNNDGQIKGVDKSIDVNERGRITVEILDLNRGALYKNRQSILNKFIDDLNVIYQVNLKGSLGDDNLKIFLIEISKRIVKSKKISEEYSLWGKFINDYFEDCIANNYIEPFKSKLIECFNGVK